MGAALRGRAVRPRRRAVRVPADGRYPPRVTTTDMSADDVLWDITPLLPAPGDEGLSELLDQADARAETLAAGHGRVAEFDATQLADFMQVLADVHDLIGRAGSYVGLDFATD